MIRIYCPEFTGIDQDLILGPDQSHYLKNVMRRLVGDEVAIFNPQQGEWLARIVEINKKSLTLCPVSPIKPPINGLGGPILVMALINRQRLETVIEKATELGVSQIVLVHTMRTKGDHANLLRLQAIAIEAAEQTERLDVPLVIGPMSLKEAYQSLKIQKTYFADEDLANKHWSAQGAALIQNGPSAKECAVLIGPEGGFDPSERCWINDQGVSIALGLGPRILRADTAAIAALSLLQALAGDWWTVTA